MIQLGKITDEAQEEKKFFQGQHNRVGMQLEPLHF